jgi:hypothetical protein
LGEVACQQAKYVQASATLTVSSSLSIFQKRPEVGYIGLQTHDPGDVVYFKDVSVRPMPAAK